MLKGRGFEQKSGGRSVLLGEVGAVGGVKASAEWVRSACGENGAESRDFAFVDACGAPAEVAVDMRRYCLRPGTMWASTTSRWN
jgi:hypothetical protein